MSEIETSAWDGRPPGDAAEVDGWHWLTNGTDTEPHEWLGDPDKWSFGGTWNAIAGPPENAAKIGWRYLGPCITPAERDALAAQAKKAEGMAEALEFIAGSDPDTSTSHPSAGRSPEKAMDQRISRARTALAAWRAAAAKEVGDGEVS